MCVCAVCSAVSDSGTPWAVARQAPLSVGFSRQEHWRGAIPLRGFTCIVNSNAEGWGLTSLSQEEGVWTRSRSGSELLPLLGQPPRLPQARGPGPLSGFPLRSPLACLFPVINRPLCNLGVSGWFC